MSNICDFHLTLYEAIQASDKGREQLCAELRRQGHSVNPTTLWRWATGASHPQPKHLKTLQALADLLDLTPTTKAEYHRALNALFGITSHRAGSAPLWYRTETLGEVPYFAGRAAEVDQLRAALHQHQSVLIHGLAGVGKTTLARRLLITEAAHFTHGCRAIRLYPHHQPHEVAHWVAQALELKLPEALWRKESLPLALAELRPQLTGADMLFLLDNVEHERQIRPIMEVAPNITWLTTSRRPLHFPGAYVCPLKPPPHLDATQMLCHYAEVVSPTPSEQAQAAEIVARLGCLPLAIQFAGRLVTSFTVRGLPELATWLEAHGVRGLRLENHHLARFFQQILETLPASSQALFALCGAFCKPRIARRLFKTIATELGWDATELHRLHELSFIEWPADDNFFELHPLVHEYARHCWLTQPQRPAGEAAFAGAYVTFAEQNNGEFEVLRAEWLNVQVAQDYLWQQQAWALFLRLWSPLTRQLWTIGDKANYRAFDERCLHAARASGERAIEASVLAELGWVAMENGHLVEAEAHSRPPNKYARPKTGNRWKKRGSGVIAPC